MTSWRAWAVRRLRANATLVAVLFGVVALTCAILAGSLGNSALLATRAAQAALANPDSGDAGMQLQTRVGDDAAAQDALVRETLTATFAPVPVTIWTTLLSEPRTATSAGAELPGRVVLAAADQLSEPELLLVEGRWPTGPGEATLQSEAAGHLGLTVGSVITIDGADLTITGTWRAVAPDAALWLRDPLLRAGSDANSYGPLLTTPDVVTGTGSAFIRWVVVPDVSSITASQLSMLKERADLAAEAATAADVSGRGIVITGDLGPTAAQAARDAASGDAFGFLPVSVLILIAVVGLTQVAGLLAAAREPEDALLVARGSSPRQGLTVSLTESLLVALAGAAVGTGLAAVVIALVSGGGGQLRAVLVGGAAGALVAFGCLAGVNVRSVLLSFRGHRPRRDRVRRLAGAALLLLTVALATLTTWQLRSGNGFIRIDEGGHARLDIISALSPALLLAVAAVLVLVVLAPLTRIVEVTMRTTRPAGAWLASAQVARGLGLQAVAVVLTVLATGTATFAALFAGTSAGLSADIDAVSQAAPMRAQLDDATADPFTLPPVADIEGVTDVVPVWRQDRAQLGDQFLPLVAAPIADLAHIVELPAGTSLPPADVMRAAIPSAEGAESIHIPAGATVTVTIGAAISLDPWQAATLAIFPEQVRKEEELSGAPVDLTDEYVDAALADLRAPASAHVELVVRDPATDQARSVESDSVTVQPGRFVHGEGFSGLRLEPAEATGSFTIDLGETGDLDLERIALHISEGTLAGRTIRLTLSVSVDGTPALGADTAAWVADTAFPAAEASAYREAEEAASPAVAKVETFTTDDGAEGVRPTTNAPQLPGLELDNSGEQWVLTSHGIASDGGSASTVVVSPFETFSGSDPLGAHRAVKRAPLLVPVALTPETSAATTLTIGDRVDLNAGGARIPGVIAAITDVVPSVPGSLGLLVDSPSLNRVLLERGAEVAAPDELWAGIDGDPRAVRAAVAATPGIASVTVTTPTRQDTADVAASALWVASACAIALAVAGLAATSATMTATRRPEVAVLRALGMTPRAQARSRAAESGGILALSAILGILGGWAVARLVVVPVALTATMDDPSFPVTVRVSWLPLAGLLAAGIIAAGIIVAWQAAAVRRQALDLTYREEVR